MGKSINFPVGDRTTFEGLDELDLQELQFFSKNRLELDILNINQSEEDILSEEDNDVIDDLDIDPAELNCNLNNSDENVELIFKHEKCLAEECELIPVCCLNEGHPFLATMDKNPEIIFDLKEAGLLEEIEYPEELFEVKIPASNIDELLKQKGEEDKSKAHLMVVQNNRVAKFIDKEETFINKMSIHKKMSSGKTHHI